MRDGGYAWLPSVTMHALFSLVTSLTIGTAWHANVIICVHMQPPHTLLDRYHIVYVVSLDESINYEEPKWHLSTIHSSA